MAVLWRVCKYSQNLLPFKLIIKFLYLHKQLLGNSLEGSIPYLMFNKDIFDANLKEMVPKNFEKKDWNDDTADICLVGNLPFNISLPLTFKLLKEISLKSDIFEYGRIPMTFAFQKEVCDRFTAKPGSAQYSRLSVMSQYLCEVSTKFTIPGTYYT